MEKYNKKDYYNLLILTIFLFISITIILLLTKDSIFGSKLDWIDQHYMLPEYLRTLFYETKNLFPNFALNLGMGQNIYNFSYYGLFSPIILISYLLPFIKMVDYIQISSIILLILDILLLYKWISNHFENKKIRFITTFIFLTSAPLILHSHRHIMFVNYTPFLLMGLIAIDNYFKNNKKIMLILSISLIILTSYFFSISALITLILYAIFIYLKNNQNIKIIPFIKEGLKLSIYFIIPVLITAVLLLPTFAAILNNRLDTNTTISLLNLITPNISFNYALYSSYTLGLTSILIPSIIHNILNKQKEYKYLAITILLYILFPIINYILNGTMYINAKVLIPLIPLATLLIAKLLNDLEQKQINLKRLIILTLIISIIIFLKTSNKILFTFDIITILLTISLSNKNKYKNLLPIAIILISTINLFTANLNDNLATKEQINEQYSNNINELIKENNSLEKTHVESEKNINDSNNIRNINEMKTTMYSSLTNKYYNNFYWNEINNNNPYRNSTIISGTNNVLYNIYTNTKNYITKENPPIGYIKTNQNENYVLYQNNNTFKTIYANSNLMSKEQYENLSYPYNIEALLNYTIVDKAPRTNYQTKIKEISINEEKIPFKKEQNKYQLNLKEEQTFSIKLDNDYTNKIILIRINMEYSQSCSKGDTYIKINDIKNTLTCKSWKYHNNNYTFDYVLSSNKNINELNITMSKGIFVISDIKLYEMDYNDIKNITNTHDNLNITDIKENEIKGNIYVKEDSYLNINIPYDKGFEIYIDNKKQDYELINKAFIGTKISQGYHEIKIIYQSPLLKEAKIISLIGIILFTTVIVQEKRRSKNEKNISNNTML